MISETVKELATKDERKQSFLDGYIASFLACFAVTKYQNCCMKGDFSEIENPPCFEDAKHLAECAWNKMQEIEC